MNEYSLTTRAVSNLVNVENAAFPLPNIVYAKFSDSGAEKSKLKIISIAEFLQNWQNCNIHIYSKYCSIFVLSEIKITLCCEL